MDASQIQFYGDLVEMQAQALGDRLYILHEDREVSFSDFHASTCRAANSVIAHGGEPGDGVALLMGNCVEYLSIFYGLPRGGFYSVPVNVALKKEGLRYILKHSDVRFLVVDDVLYPRFAELGEDVGAVRKVFVRRTETGDLPPGTIDLDTFWSAPSRKPGHVMDREAITHLMYTSGTTGFPKGVVNRNRSANMAGFMGLASIIYTEEDVLYTALPLFHANALVLTAGFAMCRGVPFGLEKRFSASGFWDSIRRYGATTFNALGAMVPILMKQPERPDDADNLVRLCVTAACPANLWEAFERRFGLKIWEAYGAVDGGGTLIFNFGNAPVGSVGKPINVPAWKLVSDRGQEVLCGEVGELVVKVPDEKTGGVEYYKNRDASQKKLHGGWLHSGDLFFADKEGNLYFVDRKSDCMRRRGENISSFEVENTVEKHPGVAECAAFGVPSELGEEEVMIWVRPKEGIELDPKDLMRHCAKNMAHYMVPRYVDIVNEMPRTETLRVIKTEMKKRGVSERTWDREKEMPGRLG